MSERGGTRSLRQMQKMSAGSLIALLDNTIRQSKSYHRIHLTPRRADPAGGDKVKRLGRVIASQMRLVATITLR
jgi:hypothetical protein